jgi:hypothetical protein
MPSNPMPIPPLQPVHNHNHNHNAASPFLTANQIYQPQALQNLVQKIHLKKLKKEKEKEKEKEKKAREKNKDEGKARKVFEESLKKRGDGYDMGDFVRDVVEAFDLEGVMTVRGPGEVEAEVEEEKSGLVEEEEEVHEYEYSQDEEVLEMEVVDIEV